MAKFEEVESRRVTCPWAVPANQSLVFMIQPLLKTVGALSAMDQHCDLDHSIYRPPSRVGQPKMGETAFMVDHQALFRPRNRFCET